MKNFTIYDILQIVSVTLLGVICSVLLHWILLIGFLPGFIFLVIKCLQKGYSALYLYDCAKNGFFKTKEVMIILLLVGLLLPSWELAGTIDQMVDFILLAINPSYFYVSAFISTLVISMILGTSVGSLSAIGIPIIGAALSIGMSVELTAGALVSGAFVGDRTSPFSSANHLLSNTIEIERKPFQKSLWRTGIVGVIISFVFYLSIDISASNTLHQNVSASPTSNNWVVALPVLALIVLAFLKIKIKYCFIASIIIALLLTIIREGFNSDMFINLWFGTTKTGGGLYKILPLISFIGLAGAYNGIIEALSIFQAILTKWIGETTSMITMTWKTMVATLLITMLACNQTLPIILTGRSFLADWNKKQSSSEFARVMADSSMLFAGMIPWSVLAIMCSTVLQVPLFSYLPYTILIWSLPIITIAYSFILSKMTESKKLLSH